MCTRACCRMKAARGRDDDYVMLVQTAQDEEGEDVEDFLPIDRSDGQPPAGDPGEAPARAGRLRPGPHEPHHPGKLALLPDSPGCYLMKEQGRIIYVARQVPAQPGAQLLRGQDHTPKVAALVSAWTTLT